MIPIQIRDAIKSFGDRRALAGASLDLRSGEILGLLGPNGAGKSTLVRTIMGRVRPDSGDVLIFGKPAEAGDSAARTEVGFVPQDIALYGDLTAAENLRVFGRYLGLAGDALREAIERSLSWSGLADRKGDRTRTFSGGMKRRLNIAAGVLHRPKVLLLDEPTVGVDPQSRERIYEMIESLRNDAVSIIYTTHYMEEAERLCDRIAIIDHGRVIAEGTKDELVARTIGTEREVVIETSEAIAEEARGELTAHGAEIIGQQIVVRSENPAAAVSDVLQLAAKHDVPILDMKMKAPTLENVFLHLTGRELRE